MAVGDVKVRLRAASSENIRPRAMQQSAVAIDTIVLDENGLPIAGATLHLGYLLTNNLRVTVRNRVTDVNGKASVALSINDVGLVRAFVEVVTPQAEVFEREIDMIARKTGATNRKLKMMVTPDGRYLMLRNGKVMSGGTSNV